MTQIVDFPNQANNQDWEALFTLVNDEVTPPIPHILDLSIVRLQLRPEAGSAEILIDAVMQAVPPDDALIRLTPEDINAATVRLSVRAAKMRQLLPRAYVYDIILVRPTGRAYRPVKGSLPLAQGVTDLP